MGLRTTSSHEGHYNLNKIGLRVVWWEGRGLLQHNPASSEVKKLKLKVCRYILKADCQEGIPWMGQYIFNTEMEEIFFFRGKGIILLLSLIGLLNNKKK